jgi:hypothetical protein
MKHLFLLTFFLSGFLVTEGRSAEICKWSEASLPGWQTLRTIPGTTCQNMLLPFDVEVKDARWQVAIFDGALQLGNMKTGIVLLTEDYQDFIVPVVGMPGQITISESGYKKMQEVILRMYPKVPFEGFWR